VFGGTSEGRTLCEVLSEKKIPALLCVATEYGEKLAPASDLIKIHTGRLDENGMKVLFASEKPRLAIDAAHPYATLARENINAVCKKTGVKLIRLRREALRTENCKIFSSIDEITEWLKTTEGEIFSTLGAKEAPAFVNFKERIWLRVLPDPAGLSACLSLGFSARRIICMQGPFSKELNAATFRETGARILLTKESGAAGGFAEKIKAAEERGLTVAVLSRPRDCGGVTLCELIKLIEEGKLLNASQ
jgi:precorrin-6x reductase